MGTCSSNARVRVAADNVSCCTSFVTIGDTNRQAVAGRYSVVRRLEDDFIVDKSCVLGQGIGGPVCVAKRRAGSGGSGAGAVKSKHAVKSLNKKGLNVERRRNLMNEAQLYLELDHPHIVRLEQVYETQDCIHLVMECMEGGELYCHLARKQRFKEKQAIAIVKQMLSAVMYLHDHGVVHRDLKVENFLYESKSKKHLKLCDFGFATRWDGKENMKRRCGSEAYIAPEVLVGSYTEKADMWSIGVMCFMMLTGRMVFVGSEAEIFKQLQMGRVNYGNLFDDLSNSALKFVQSLLVLSQDQRLSASDALQHPWLQDDCPKIEVPRVDFGILESLRSFSQTQGFRRACLSLIAWCIPVDEAAVLLEQFHIMDLAGNGTISLSEFLHAYQAVDFADESEAVAVFQKLDTNNEGQITYRQFIAATWQGRVQLPDAAVHETFCRFDADASGEITTENLRFVVGDKFAGFKAEELIQEADEDGDGAVSYKDFQMFVQRECGMTSLSPVELPSCTQKTSVKLEERKEMVAVPGVPARVNDGCLPTSQVLAKVIGCIA